MRLIQQPQRRERELSLIPLINVVFLLLIFFMLAGTVSPSDKLPVEPPTSKQGQRLSHDAPQILLDSRGRIALDGTIIVLSQLQDRLRESIATNDSRAEEGQSALDDKSRTPLALSVKADGAVVSSQLRALLAELRALGVEQVQLLVRQD